MSDFPYSEAETVAFLQRDVPSLLARLDPAQVPVWGQMTAQHMVEHLTGALRLSMGRYGLPAPPPARPSTKCKLIYWPMLPSTSALLIPGRCANRARCISRRWPRRMLPCC